MRVYKRKNRHVRNGKTFVAYNSYTPEDLNKAVSAIRAGRMTLNDASKLYKIPKATLSRKWRNISKQEKAGHPTLFTVVEEKTFINYMNILSEWGFPFDLLDLRILAQKYLNKIGKKVYTLSDNMPGSDWARNFLVRHKDEISNRTSTNISTDRAKVSPAILDSFFENWIQTVDGVDPSRVINYDETNLSDDPGSKKYIYKRGVKYPERVMNSSKTAISLMFSATASGLLLPTYVVYKAEHLWDTWYQGGPKNTKYNRSKSGWFDNVCFEDWFNSVIVPYAKKQNGEKVVLIGDNLSSHFSQNVLKTCKELNIVFSCLPPKSTHILQPLDVALFGPLKHYWRKILTDWKRLEGRKHKTLVKSCFPKLLKELHEKLTENDVGSNNIIAGFRKSGLYPVNPEIPLSRLPQSSTIPEEVNSATAEVITEMLKEMRGISAPESQIRRKKRCQVPPGKSISAEDILPVEPKKSIAQKKNKQVKRNRRPSIDLPSDTSFSDENDNQSPELSDTSTIIDISALDIYNVSAPGPSGLRRKRQSEEVSKTVKIKKRKMSHVKTKKGKGVGKKSRTCNKENLVTNSQKTAQSSLKKKARRLSSCSTSVTDCISVHSDSDLIDMLDDFDMDRDLGILRVFSVNEPEEASDRSKETRDISEERSVNLEETSDKSEEARNISEDKDLEETSDKLKDPMDISKVKNKEPEEIIDISEKAKDRSEERNEDSTGAKDTSENVRDQSKETNEYSMGARNTLEDVRDRSKERNEDSKEAKNISEDVRDRSEERNTDPEDARHISKEKIEDPTEMNERPWEGNKNQEEAINTSKEMNKEAGEVSDRPGHKEIAVDLENLPIINKCFEENYDVNEHVLVRYYKKKKWSYYVGYVEEIKPGPGSDTCYQIRFYRTVRKPLRFVFTKRPDRDVVPTLSIVKKIYVVQGPNNAKEFFLSDQGDSIYFS